MAGVRLAGTEPSLFRLIEAQEPAQKVSGGLSGMKEARYNRFESVVRTAGTTGAVKEYDCRRIESKEYCRAARRALASSAKNTFPAPMFAPSKLSPDWAALLYSAEVRSIPCCCAMRRRTLRRTRRCGRSFPVLSRQHPHADDEELDVVDGAAATARFFAQAMLPEFLAFCPVLWNPNTRPD